MIANSGGSQAATIEIRLATPHQLFNTFDPSPFHEKDLDREAENYIAGWADEFPMAQPLRLLVHIPSEQIALAQSLELEKAIQNYFTYRRSDMERRLRFLFREGRVALGIGVVFLVSCMSLRELMPMVATGPVARVLQEGSLILGWVAMWRPLQIFLYEWWPMRHRARLFGKLAHTPVGLRSGSRHDEPPLGFSGKATRSDPGTAGDRM